MNCKPGDLAIVVGVCVNRDALVRVIEFENFAFDEWRCEALQSVAVYDEMGEPTGRRPAGAIVYAPDRNLRPIRDSDGTDEILRIAGKPAELLPA